jgi:hypothetical protein
MAKGRRAEDGKIVGVIEEAKGSRSDMERSGINSAITC